MPCCTCSVPGDPAFALSITILRTFWLRARRLGLTPRRLLKLVSRGPKKSGLPPAYAFPTEESVWTMGRFCALNRRV